MTRRVFLDDGLSAEARATVAELVEMYEGNEESSLFVIDPKGVGRRWTADKIIRTGSLGLDMAIGIGGIPRGRFVEVFGPESSGKTTLALHLVKEAQQQGVVCVYIDAENALDPVYMQSIGVDISALPIAQPNGLEKAIDQMNTLMETGKVGLIVVDSIPALKSTIVLEGDADQETRALEARRWAAQVPRLSRNAMKYNCTIMFINQQRESMDMYKPFTTPGGTALKFAYSLRMRVKAIMEGKKNNGIDYHQMEVDLQKNKVGIPFRKCSLFFMPGTGVDWTEDVFIAATQWEVIKEDQRYDEPGGDSIVKKGWYSVPLEPGDLEAIRIDDPDFEEPETGAFQVYQYGKMLAALTAHPAFVEVIEERTLNTLSPERISAILEETQPVEDDVEADE